MKTDFPRVELRGLLGKALRRSCEKRLKTVDYGQLVEPFRLRNEADGGWRCEFWGKVVRSAILTNYYVNDAQLADTIGQCLFLFRIENSHSGPFFGTEIGGTDTAHGEPYDPYRTILKIQHNKKPFYNKIRTLRRSARD